MIKGVIKKKIQDWRVASGVEVENPDDLKEYDLEVSIDNGQLYITVADEKDENNGLSVIVEINEGQPCVHLGTDVCGDNILHAFSVNGSLIVTPENSRGSVTLAEKSRYTYNESNSFEFR